MPKGGKYSPKDYLVLGIAAFLALAFWLGQNLSKPYSELVHRRVIIRSDVPGHSNEALSPSEIAVRCDMRGFDILADRISGSRKTLFLDVAPEHIRHRKGDEYYMTADDLSRYFHNVCGANAKLDYFVSDTLNFILRSVEYKKVPVKAVSSLSFMSQYMSVAGLKVIPDSVLVYGDSELLDKVASVSTNLIRLPDVSEDVVGEIRLQSIPSARLSVDFVRYSMQVVRFVEQTFTVPVRLSNVPNGSNVMVLPSMAFVKLRTQFPGLNDADDLYVEVDFRDFRDSVSGKCVGSLKGVSSTVLSSVVEPEVFRCILMSGADE